MRNTPRWPLLFPLLLCLVPHVVEARGGGSERGYDVTIRRATYGIPHVCAKDFASLGYGSGDAFAEDNVCVLARSVLKVRGEPLTIRGGEAGSGSLR